MFYKPLPRRITSNVRFSNSIDLFRTKEFDTVRPLNQRMRSRKQFRGRQNRMLYFRSKDFNQVQLTVDWIRWKFISILFGVITSDFQDFQGRASYRFYILSY